MNKIEAKMNSVYESGEILGYATATIDDVIEIRGIKILDVGEGRQNVHLGYPKCEGIDAIGFGNRDFNMQLGVAVNAAYCEATGIENKRNFDVKGNIDICHVEISVNRLELSPKCTQRAVVTAVLGDGLSINNMLVLEKENSVEVQMPQEKTIDGAEDIITFIDQDYEFTFKESILNSYMSRMTEAAFTFLSELKAKEAQQESQNQEESQEEMEESEQEQEEPVENMGMGGMTDV